MSHEFERIKKDAEWDGKTKSGYKGYLAKVDKTNLTTYEFQFNPTTLSGSEGSKWDLFSTPGNILPIASFLHTDPANLDVELFVEAMFPEKTPSGKSTLNMARYFGSTFVGVWADIMAVAVMMKPDIASSNFDATGRFASPTPVILGMGPIVRRCILQSMSWKIQKFFRDLTPAVATISLKLTPISESQKTSFEDLKTLIINTTTRNTKTPIISGMTSTGFASA